MSSGDAESTLQNLHLNTLGPGRYSTNSIPIPPSPRLPESNSTQAAAAEDSLPPTKSAIELRGGGEAAKPYQIPNRENGRSGRRLPDPIAMDGGGIGGAAAESGGGFGWGAVGVGKAEA